MEKLIVLMVLMKKPALTIFVHRLVAKLDVILLLQEESVLVLKDTNSMNVSTEPVVTSMNVQNGVTVTSSVKTIVLDSLAVVSEVVSNSR